MSTLAGKTVVITGASAGTGAAAARRLHAAGARVVPVGGSPGKTALIAKELGVPALTVDLCSLSDVRRLASDLRDSVGKIDILALNAGGVVAQDAPTADGIEPNLQLNAIGPWLLLQLLADRVAGGRVISTSSRTHAGAKIANLDDLASKGRLGWHGVYARAKLAGGILLREFGRRHPDTIVADFHPGIIASDMGRYMGPLGTFLKYASSPFIKSPEDGADRLMFLASTDTDIAYRYFMGDKPAKGAPQLGDRVLANELWAMAEQLTRI